MAGPFELSQSYSYLPMSTFLKRIETIFIQSTIVHNFWLTSLAQPTSNFLPLHIFPPVSTKAIMASSFLLNSKKA